MPKAESRNGYMILEGSQAKWVDCSGEVYHSLEL